MDFGRAKKVSTYITKTPFNARVFLFLKFLQINPQRRLLTTQKKIKEKL